MSLFWQRRGCRAHRTALLEFARQRTGGSAVRRALDHVERCRACEDQLAATSLVLVGLRRLHEDVQRAEPATDGWTRLRARLATTRREPSRLLSGLPGIVAAAGLCAALVGPNAIAGGESSAVYNEAPRRITPPSPVVEQTRTRAEAARLLPVPPPIRSYTGVRTTPTPFEEDLPLPMRRETAWIQQVVQATAPSAITLTVAPSVTTMTVAPSSSTPTAVKAPRRPAGRR